MWPMIGSLRTYMIFYTLSMIVQAVLAIRLCRRRGLTWRTGAVLGICYVAGMTLGAKVLYDLLNHHFAWRNYFHLTFYLQGGMWGGPLAYLGIAVPGVLLLADERRKLLDIIALGLPVPMIVAKAACLVNGCCHGARSSLPWAMRLAEGAEGPAGVPLHPTPLYEMLMLGVVLVVLMRLDTLRWRGTLVAWLILLYGIGRPLTEIFRAPEALRMTVGPVSASQLICLGGAVMGGAALWLLKPRQTEAAEPPLAGASG